MKNILNEENQIHNFISSSGSGTIINYGSGSDFLKSYGSGSASQNVTVPTVPGAQHCLPGLSLGLVKDGLHADAAGLLPGARHREAQLHIPLVLAQTLLRWKSKRIKSHRFSIDF
jgi:hypothetical protein